MSEPLINRIYDLKISGFEDAFIKVTNLIKAFSDLDAQKIKADEQLKKAVQVGDTETIEKLSAKIKELETALKNLDTQKAQSIKTATALAGEDEKARKKIKDLTDAELRSREKEKIETAKRVSDIRLEIKENQAASGSLEQKRFTLSRLQKQYDSLTNAIQKSADGKALLTQIQQLDAEVKKLEGSTGRFRLNVGDYENKFKSLADAGRAGLDKLNNGFKDLFRNIAATAASFIGIQGLFSFGKESLEAFEQADAQSARLENALKNLGASQKEIKGLRDQVIELGKAFPYLTTPDILGVQQKLVQYGKLTASQMKELTPTILNFAANQRISVGEATDAILRSLEGNAKALKIYGINIRDAKTDSERFELVQKRLGETVKGAGDVFAGTSAGKVEIYKKKLQELKIQVGDQLMPVYQSFLQGSINIIEVIKKIDFANIVKGIAAIAGVWILYKTAVLTANIATAINSSALIANRVITEGCTVAKAAETLAEETNGKTKAANTILTYLMIAAQKAYAFITRLATAEMQLFNGAIKISPLGIFLTLLGVVITAFTAFADKVSISNNALNRNKEVLKDIHDIEAEANKNSNDQIAIINEKVRKINDERTSLEEKRKTLKELIALDPDYLKGLKLSKDGHLEGAQAIDEYISALRRQAAAEATQQKRIELEKRKAEIEGPGKFVEQNPTSKVLINGKLVTVRNQLYVDPSTKYELDQETKSINNQLDALDAYEKSLAITTKKKVEFNEASGLGKFGGDKPVKEKHDPLIDEPLKALERERDAAKKIVDSDQIKYSKRIEALKTFADISKEIIKYNEDKILNNSKATEKEKSAAVKAAYYERITLAEESAKLLSAIDKNQFDTEEKLLKKQFDSQKSAIELAAGTTETDPSKTAEEKALARKKANQLLKNATIEYYYNEAVLAKKYNQDSEQLEEERKKAIDDIKKSGLKTDYDIAQAKLKDLKDFGAREVQEIEKNYNIIRKSILDNDRLTSAQKKNQLDELDKAEKRTILSSELETLNKQVDLEKKLLDANLISNDEYLAAVAAQKKKAADLSAASPANTTPQVSPANFSDLLASGSKGRGGLGKLLGLDDKGTDGDKLEKNKLLGDVIATSFNLAGEAMNNYFDQERQRVEQSKNLAYQRIDLEKQQLLNTAQSQAERDSIEKQSAIKKQKADKDAGEQLKKIKKSEAKISLATELANIAAAAAANPLNPFTFGGAGAIMYGILAALALGRYALNISNIDKQQFAGSGKVKPLYAGRITALPNIPTQPNGDNVLATVKPGEVILNEVHQRMLGGAKTFRAIGVPGFADGGLVSLGGPAPGSNLQPPVNPSSFLHGNNTGSINVVLDAINQQTENLNETARQIHQRIDKLQVHVSAREVVAIDNKTKKASQIGTL